MTTYLVDFENVKSDGLNGIANLLQQDRVVIFYSINADKITFDLHNKMNQSVAAIEFYNVEVGHKNALDFQLASYLGYLLAQCKECEYVIVSNDAGYSPLVNFWNKAGFKVKLIPDLKRIAYRAQMVGAEQVKSIATQEEKSIVKEEVKPVVKEEIKPVVKEESKAVVKEKNKPVMKEEMKKAEAKPIVSEQINEPVKEESAQNESDDLFSQVNKIVENNEEAKLLTEYIQKYKTKQGLNNAIVKVYGTTKGGNLYKQIKPFIQNKKGK